MDTATRHMLADLGAATRTALVTSVSAKDLHGSYSRPMKKVHGRFDSGTESMLNKWNTFHVQEEAQQVAGTRAPAPQVAQQPAVATAPAPQVNRRVVFSDTPAYKIAQQATTTAVPVPQVAKKVADAAAPVTLATQPVVKVIPPAASTEAPRTKAVNDTPGSFSFKLNSAGGNTKEGAARIRSPIELSLTLTSKSDYIGVLELASMMENLAQAMQTMSFQVMKGARDDGTGLFDVDDMLTDLERADRE